MNSSDRGCAEAAAEATSSFCDVGLGDSGRAAVSGGTAAAAAFFEAVFLVAHLAFLDWMHRSDAIRLAYSDSPPSPTAAASLSSSSP